MGSYFERKERNAVNRTHAENYGEKIEFLEKNDFENQFPNPFDLINEVLKIGKVGYSLKKVELSEYIKTGTYNPVFINLEGDEVDIQSFSSGEKVLVSLALAIFNSKGKYSVKSHLNCLLFDEIDASLHPSMTKKLIDVVQEHFLPRGIRVILTTHSPTTVALSPENSLYLMVKENGKTIFQKTNKSDALRELLDGVRSVDIRCEVKRYIFTEAITDRLFYSEVYRLLRDYISSAITMEFISTEKRKSSGSEDGGVGLLKKIVSSLRKKGNNDIFGIVDWDREDNKIEGIFPHCEREMYSLENIVLAPYFIGILLLREGFLNSSDIISNSPPGHIEFVKNIENIVALSKYVENKVFGEDQGEIREITLINEEKIPIGEKYRHCKGHELKRKLKETFPKLKKYNNPSTLVEHIIKSIFKDFFNLLPKGTLNVLMRIEKAQKTS